MTASAVNSRFRSCIQAFRSAGRRTEQSARVVSNSRADAGQTVQHLHFHILGGKALALEMA